MKITQNYCTYNSLNSNKNASITSTRQNNSNDRYVPSNKNLSNKQLAFKSIFEKTLYKPISKTMLPIDPELKNKIENVTLTTEDDLKINAWHIKADPNKPTILFCHGVKYNRSEFQDIPKELHKKGYNSFIADYRGFDGNPGRPSEKGVCKDVKAAVKYLNKQGIKNNIIIIWGYSMCGAIVTNVAQNKDFKAVILQSTFSNMKEQIATQSKPKQILAKVLGLSSKYTTDQRIPNIQAPLLITHSKTDQFIPYKMAEKLHSIKPDSKLVLTNNGEHADYNTDEALSTCLDFIDKVSN